MTVWHLLLGMGLGLTVSTPMTFISGPVSAANSSISVSAASVTANGTSTTTLTVLARDAYNNPVSTSVSLTGSGGNNVFGAASSNTDATGQFVTTLASTQVQTETITATLGGSVNPNVTITFVVGPATSAQSSLVVSPSSQTADNTSVITATLTLKDAQAHPISGATPTFTATGSSTTVSASSATNASGQSSATYKTSLAQSENANVTVSGLTLTQAMTFVAGPPTQAASSFAVSPNSLVADGSSLATLTVTARDAQGNLVNATTVSMAGSGGNNTFAPASGSTNTSGVWSTTLKSTQVQTETLTATINGNVTETASITFTVGAASASTSSFAVTPTTQTDNNSSVITATLTLKDALAHPLPGVTPTFGYSGSATTVSTASATNASGQSVVTYKSSLAQSQNVTVTAGGLNYATPVTFVPGPVSATYSSLAASPTSLVANGTTASTLSVHLADSTNNSIANQRVAYSVAGGAGPLTYVSTVTNASGNTTNTLYSPQLGANKVYASAQGVFLSTSVSYTAPTAYCTGNPGYSSTTLTGLNGPSCAGLADFNNDGKLDLHVANNSNQVNIYLGTGSGTFGSAITSYAGGSCNSYAFTDLNGDGKLDIVYSNAGYAISTAFGSGNGAFISATTYGSTVAGTESVVADDFDNDGYPDVAVVAIFQSAVGVMLNNGTGGLRAITTYNTSGGSYGVTSGDFNGDGLRDIAVAANNNNTVSVLLGTGGGTFGSYAYYPVGNSPWALSVADFNGDGYQDLAVATNGDNVVSVLTGTGTGTFNARATYAAGSGPRMFSLADYNGDGRTDILILNNDNTMSLLMNSGSGSFNAQVTRPSAGSFAGAGDLNGDAHTDIFTLQPAANAGYIYLYNACN